MNKRRIDIDWLRIFASYLLIPYHTACIFREFRFYHIKNIEFSISLELFGDFIHQWHMRLFFFLAGWSVLISLSKRGFKEFTLERVKKLLVPLIFGTIFLSSILRYTEIVHGLLKTPGGQVIPAQPEMGFFEFLPSFFGPHISWSHLWFLAYLIVFTLLFFPFFKRLKALQYSPKNLSPLWVYLPIIPLAIVQLTLRDRWPGFQNLYDDWANFSFYSLFFIFGYICALYSGFEKALHREWLRAGLLGFLSCLLYLSKCLPTEINHILSAIAAWGIVVGLLGFANRYFKYSGPIFTYLKDSAFPVYVLHNVAVVLVAWHIVPLNLPIWLKFSIILTGATVSTVVVYHFCVRKSRILGIAFGRF